MGACGSSEAEAVQANTAAADKKAESKEVISSKASRKTLKQSEESKKEPKVDINDSNTDHVVDNKPDHNHISKNFNQQLFEVVILRVLSSISGPCLVCRGFV